MAKVRAKAIIVAAVTVAFGLLLAALSTYTIARSSGDDNGRTSDGAWAPEVPLERRITDFTAGLDPDGDYREPRRAERRDIAHAVGLILDGHPDRARPLLADVGFRLRTLTDTGIGRRYAELSDRTGDGPDPRGWARVYVDLSAPVRWSVQVPHPVSDADTERLGARVLLDSPGGVLVLAGAHRRAGDDDAADAAHRTDSVFDAVCDELARRGLPGVQLHGFADDSAPGRDVVASTGEGRAGRPDARRLAAALTARHFSVCRAWVRDCPLEGRDNVQGRRAATGHVPFLHIEFARSVRASDRQIGHAVAAIGTVTARWAKDDSG
ncbi:hypothetical protein [Streptomyces rapamycinicus]|uniref:Uncharacterized protein n=2 Tax=Streptomyces rapamycinicus TaxID=1226757 RepID=A0A0A0N8D7_STRRN|nr:hypothetical protein [Streptomyces rapamycinicus]AGP53391.1 hypothetical protein M271_08860 [Streptomyces rapamycinicus NRRL 5491]MBB4780877.1 hypothetical protein [Streptomyces rapamycinicus]RLV74476.1 hypothetical protein D3C57_134660 [Streptomyces rapamycinicus NRRL 5491]UTO61561.1 hypothetical protein LJB45_03895 [Streptomyces rapamycinicus]UTP29509.1 hypothetical protein LIV37_09020 [Streptomyces rapamycinicus NRRL 5491]